MPKEEEGKEEEVKQIFHINEKTDISNKTKV